MGLYLVKIELISETEYELVKAYTEAEAIQKVDKIYPTYISIKVKEVIS